MHPLRLFLLSVFFVATGICVMAGGKSSKSDRPTEARQGLSWLLPIAFQSAPELDMTFVTEMSEAGRKVAPPTEERPTFYVIHATGSHTYGDSIYRTKPPTEEDLRHTMRRTLAAAHYQEVESFDRAPDLAIFYHWGVHAGIDPMTAEISPDLAERNLRERMLLVGGRKFTERWNRARSDDSLLRRSSAASILGAPTGIMSSEYRMEMADTATRRLLAQARHDIYFVVATAYDATSLARSQPIMLWRTKMTVSTQGVAMRETIAPLIAAAVPYLGREMDEARPIRRRIYRDGRVILGELEVLGMDDPAETPAATHAEPKSQPAPAPSTDASADSAPKP